MTTSGSPHSQPPRGSVYSRLEGLDWTFADANTRDGVHGLHPYPAKFIPQIPRTLIAALYPQDGTAVLDPFCGSGTTLVEAAAAQAPTIGIDLHPLACLISKVKLTPLSRSLLGAAESAIRRAWGNNPSIPQIPALDHWFRRDIQLTLASLVQSIDAETDADIRDALRISLSRMLVRVSNQESDTRYAAIDKEIGADDVPRLFKGAAASIERALSATWSRLTPPTDAQVINRDILAIEPKDIARPVSLVITSPPYPNAYEYWLYHKYRMYWLGMDPLAVRRLEIGARPHYFKRDPHTPADFERQMSAVFDLLAKVLTHDGHVCFQVGSSIIHGQAVDNSAILRRAAESRNFSLATSLSRTIPSSRKAFNPRNSRIKTEEILIFTLVKL